MMINHVLLRCTLHLHNDLLVVIHMVKTVGEKFSAVYFDVIRELSCK